MCEMYRCSNSHGNNDTNMVGGPCSCAGGGAGLYHCQNNSSFSMLFSMSAAGAHETTINHPYHHHQLYSFTSPNSSVDCTLSLGTPSTRGGGGGCGDYSDQPAAGKYELGGGRRSSFCWDLLSPNKYGNTPPPVMAVKSGRGGGGGDPSLARRCANCDTTSTPLWRNGPRGPKSLCNACGIRYKKEERRATAAAATNGGAGVGLMDHQYQNMMMNSNNNAGWVHQKMAPAPPSCGEFRFVDDDDNFLSWRLNVTDHGRNLVHDFT